MCACKCSMQIGFLWGKISKFKRFPSLCYSDLLLILLLRIMQNEIPCIQVFAIPMVNNFHLFAKYIDKQKNSYRRHKKRNIKNIGDLDSLAINLPEGSQELRSFKLSHCSFQALTYQGFLTPALSLSLYV